MKNTIILLKNLIRKRATQITKIMVYIYLIGEVKMSCKKDLTNELLSKIVNLEYKDKVLKNNFIKYHKPYTHEEIIIKISDVYNNSRYESILDEIKSCINVINENIGNYLKSKNFKINIVSPEYLNIYILKDLYNKNYYDLIKDKFLTKDHITLERNGLYIWGRKKIFVTYKDLDGFDIKETIFHEIGHFLDYKYDNDITYQEILNLKNMKD